MIIYRARLRSCLKTVRFLETKELVSEWHNHLTIQAPGVERVRQVLRQEQRARMSSNARATVVGRHFARKEAQSSMSIVSNQPISSPVLIGREREAATLYALIDQVRRGQGQVVLLSGEAGIGKSRLAAEGKRQANEQGFLVLQGTCFPSDRSSPYAPLLDLLSLSNANPEPLVRELARFFPGLVDHASDDTLSRALEPEQEKRRLFVALTQFF